MKKIFTRILGATLGLAMAIGVGVGVASNLNKEAKPVNAVAEAGTFEKVTSSSLTAGDIVIFVNAAATKALGDLSATSSGYGTVVDVTPDQSGKIVLTNSTTITQFTVEAGATSGYAFKSKNNTNFDGKYLAYTSTATSSSNYLNRYNTNTAGANTQAQFTISYGSNMTVRSVYNSGRWLRFNSDRFACYYHADTESTTGTGVNIYKKVATSFGTLHHIKVNTQPNVTTFTVGDTFSSSGLVLTGYDAENEATANTASYSSEFTTDFDGHTFVEGDVGEQTVTITYSGKTVTYSILVLATPVFSHTYASNSVFENTDASTSEAATYTPTSGPEYISLGGYNYESGSAMSFKKVTGMYLGNNEEYQISSTKKNIAKIVITTSSDVSTIIQMTEGPVILSEDSIINPTKRDGNKVLIYTFSGNNPFFKLKVTGTSSFINMTSIKVYLGTDYVESEVSSVSAEYVGSVYDPGSTLSASDFSVTASWTVGPDTQPTSGFTWTVNGEANGEIRAGNNVVVVTFEGHNSDPINVSGTLYSAMIERDLSTKTDLAYSYTSGAGTVDGLNKSIIGLNGATYNAGTSYLPWQDKTGSSGAIYAGKTSGGNNCVQLNSTSGNGIITTSPSTCGLSLMKVTIKWGSNANNRVVDVYGNSQAYTEVADLFDDNKKGTLIGSFTYSGAGDAYTCASFDVAEEHRSFTYIGIRSRSNAIYIDSIAIQWGEPEYTYPQAAIRFTGFISQTMWDGLNDESEIQSYGVLLSTPEHLSSAALKTKFNEVDGNYVKKFDTPITQQKANPDQANAGQKGELVGNYYVWSLGKIVTDNLQQRYTAVAYIRTSAGVVFFGEVTFSAKTLAADYLTNRGYGIGDAEGSLNNLANLA